MKRIAPVLLALALGCTSFLPDEVEPPEVHLVNLELLDASLFEQRLRVDLRVLNPNDFELPVDGLRFALEVEDDVLARGATSEAVRIPRLGDALVSVTTHTSSIALVRQILNPPRDDSWSYALSGDVFLEGFARRKISFQRSGQLPVGPSAPAGP